MVIVVVAVVRDVRQLSGRHDSLGVGIAGPPLLVYVASLVVSPKLVRCVAGTGPFTAKNA